MKQELRIEQKHSLSVYDLISKIQQLATDMQEQYHFEYNTSDELEAEYDTALSFKSTVGLTKGVEGALHLSKSRVLMVVKLPFALRPMAAKIEGEINDYMTRNLK